MSHPNNNPAQSSLTVSGRYSAFPYPSPTVDAKLDQFEELVNLVEMIGLETRYNLAGKSVLDAGVGTGHRLAALARHHPDTRFTAIDFAEQVLRIARQVAQQNEITNIRFQRDDLMAGIQSSDPFDVALCMGVLHHLHDPVKGAENLRHALAPDGFAALYLYGRAGARERLKRKEILALLTEGSRDDIKLGISLARALGFDDFDYGWTPQIDQATTDSLLVDAYFNPRETLYDIDDIHDLAKHSGFHAYVIFGVTREKSGQLFDTRPAYLASRMSPTTIRQT